MGLEHVKIKVINEAKDEAQKLREQAENEVKKLNVQMRVELNEHKKMLKESSERILQAAERREIAAAEFEGKRAVLEVRRSLIQQSADLAREKLASLGREEKAKLLRKLISLAVKQIDVKRVFASPDEVAMLGEAKSGDFELVTSESSGGIIAENADGSIRVDYSFITLLQEVLDKDVREISEVLF